MKQSKLERENPMLDRHWNKYIKSTSKQDELEKQQLELDSYGLSKFDIVIAIIISAALIIFVESFL